MLDVGAAEHVRHFLKTYCSHTKGRFAGKPFVLLPWQWNDIILPLYGSKKEDGTRVYRRCSIWTPKKVGKSTLAAGLALFHLLADNEASPECYVIASTIAEADTVFSQAASFVRGNEYLSNVCHIQRHTKRISLKSTDGFIQVLSGDKPQGKFGINGSLVLTDEVGHASPFQRQIHADLQYAGAARLQPLQISISTSSFDLDGYGYELYQEAKAAKEKPEDNPTLLPVIYSAPMTADPFDPKVWQACCPSLGETIQISDYEEEAKRAKNNPRLLDEFCTYRLAQWRSAAETWIPNHIWTQCRDTEPENKWTGHYDSFLAVDAGSKHDLFAWCVLCREGETVRVFPRAAIPGDNARMKEVKDGVRYTLWAEQYPDSFWLTDGDIIDPGFVKQKILLDCQRFNIRELAYDRAAGAELMMQDLRDNHGVFTVDVPQTMQSLSSATHLLETMVYKKTLKIPDHAVLDWCLNNCLVSRRGDVLGIEKRKQTARVDIITSIIIGLNRVIANPYIEPYVYFQ